MKNKEFFRTQLIEKNITESDADIIMEILQENSLIGRKNKEKTISVFMEKLNLEYGKADELYNTCAEVLMTNIFK